MHSIIHIEGIPGSGKTTTAQTLTELLIEQNIDAFWTLEESADHPIMPQERRKQAREPHFADVCLEAWRAFLHSHSRVAVLDGYAFQSTVRLLFASGASRADIDAYLTEWLQADQGASAFIYLVVEEPEQHLLALTEERGSDWAQKLFAYVARTELGQSQGWQGASGYSEFWARYQDLCLDLLQHMDVPVTKLKARSWRRAELQALAM